MILGMRIYRVEHVLDCDAVERHRCHGISSMGGCSSSWRTESPRFGHIGPTPDSDVIIRMGSRNARSRYDYGVEMRREQSCGVTSDQFDLWWDYESRQLKEDQGWRVVEFDVDEDDPWTTILDWQVLFLREKARRVRVSKDTQRFVGKAKKPLAYHSGLRPDLKTTLLGV
jgi:hypothetical protein